MRLAKNLDKMIPYYLSEVLKIQANIHKTQRQFFRNTTGRQDAFRTRCLRAIKIVCESVFFTNLFFSLMVISL